jgi:hypothetical protein
MLIAEASQRRLERRAIESLTHTTAFIFISISLSNSYVKTVYIEHIHFSSPLAFIFSTQRHHHLENNASWHHHAYSAAHVQKIKAIRLCRRQQQAYFKQLI